MKAFALVFAALCFLRVNLYADAGCYDSAEWMTALSDHIGVYEAARVREPDEKPKDPWRGYLADFKLVKPLRGNPPAAFSRNGIVYKADFPKFMAADTYVFFFFDHEGATAIRPTEPDSTRFCMWDYVWLERPLGARNGIAINHLGEILIEKGDIMKAIEASLKLPPASREIDRGAYFRDMGKSESPSRKDPGYRVLSFPTRHTSTKERWVFAKDWVGLVISSALSEGNSPAPGR